MDASSLPFHFQVRDQLREGSQHRALQRNLASQIWSARFFTREKLRLSTCSIGPFLGKGLAYDAFGLCTEISYYAFT